LFDVDFVLQVADWYGKFVYGVRPM
jgi:hypothetical protein